MCYSIHIDNSQKSGLAMKKLLVTCIILLICVFLFGCSAENNAPILATAKPVYCFATALCDGTPLEVELLIAENVSCLHDYTLQVNQMQKIEKAELIIINGAGFEAFITDAVPANMDTIDSSKGLTLLWQDHLHDDEHAHHHENDPHIWLSIANAETMAMNIAAGLSERYPEYQDTIANNLLSLQAKFGELKEQAKELENLSCRELVTFHDGFTYLADCFDLQILKAVEEESGSEASAHELIEIISEVKEHNLPAIFTEVSGATAAADIIAAETNTAVFCLDMAMSDRDYFDAMQYNIATLKEALE